MSLWDLATEKETNALLSICLYLELSISRDCIISSQCMTWVSFVWFQLWATKAKKELKYDKFEARQIIISMVLINKSETKGILAVEEPTHSSLFNWIPFHQIKREHVWSNLSSFLFSCNLRSYPHPPQKKYWGKIPNSTDRDDKNDRGYLSTADEKWWFQTRQPTMVFL